MSKNLWEKIDGIPLLELTHIRPSGIGVVESILMMDSDTMLKSLADRYMITSLEGDNLNYQCAIYDLIRSDIVHADEGTLLSKLKKLEEYYPNRVSKLIHETDIDVKRKLSMVIEFLFDKCIGDGSLDVAYLDFPDSSFRSIITSLLNDNFIIQSEVFNGIRFTVRITKKKEVHE